VVAIDVGGTTLKGALVDPDGAADSAQCRPTRAEQGPDAVVEAVLDLAADLAATDPRPSAVGLAVPGIVDDEAGIVRESTNLGWREVPIGELAEQRVGRPVAVLHDVRAAALAEGLIGAARGCRDYLLLTLGTGVGAAVVINGDPYTGAHGLGGELGHVAVEPGGRFCGGRGCLEALASAGHIASRYRETTAAGQSVTAEEIVQRAGSGDPAAGQIWREAIEALATAIVNYATLLDPELVVIGGGMAAAGDRLFVPLQETIAAMTRFGDPCRVVPAELEEAGRWGAAIAAWERSGVQRTAMRSWAVAS
jgi:glucokinase